MLTAVGVRTIEDESSKFSSCEQTVFLECHRGPYFLGPTLVNGRTSYHGKLWNLVDDSGAQARLLWAALSLAV